MANCSKCGRKIGFLNSSGGMCLDCVRLKYDEEQAPIRALEAQQESAQSAAKVREREAIEAVIVTTEASTNLKISKRIKIVVATAESKLVVAVTEKEDALFYDLKKECHSVGGNAVVGVSINIVESYSMRAGSGEFKKFKMIAYGTAVVIDAD